MDNNGFLVCQYIDEFYKGFSNFRGFTFGHLPNKIKNETSFLFKMHLMFKTGFTSPSDQTKKML